MDELTEAEINAAISVASFDFKSRIVISGEGATAALEDVIGRVPSISLRSYALRNATSPPEHA